MITSHNLMNATDGRCIETRFVLARCPAVKAHALQELIRAFQTDFPVPQKRKQRLSKKMLKAVTAPLKGDGLRKTLAKLGITRLEETPASA
jgi:hypothetical protein